jgi:mRNA interferase MazF
LRRGDIVLAATPGDFGKVHPAVIIQANLFLQGLNSVTLCPLTSELEDASGFRIEVTPSEDNGLRSISQIMVDRIMTIRPDKVRQVIGAIDESTTSILDQSLAAFLGLA